MLRQCFLVLCLTSVSVVVGFGGVANAIWEPAGVLENQLITSRPFRAGIEANSGSDDPSVSGDGRYVAFTSFASNLVAGDTNGMFDVFVFDRVKKKTERVSVDSVGKQGNWASDDASISSDGRYIAFNSFANNLVPGDTNGKGDMFVFDRVKKKTERVSIDSAGNQGNKDSYRWPSISGDGRYVAFGSSADNLVASDTNKSEDVFVFDRVTKRTERVSVDSAGQEGNLHSFVPSISGDGRYVAFNSDADNLVSGDTNRSRDVFVFDRVTKRTERVSVDSAGNEGNASAYGGPSVSGDGRFVAFDSDADNLVASDTNKSEDVFVFDRVTKRTERVSADSAGNEGNDASGGPSVSGDGRFVAFDSVANNLVSGDTNGKPDVFVLDRVTKKMERVSADSAGNEGNDASGGPSVSGDGRFVAFDSDADNLVVGDTNGVVDVFAHSRAVRQTERVSVSSATGAADGASFGGSVSLTGQFSAFYTSSGNLLPGDGVVGPPVDVGLWDGSAKRFLTVSSGSGEEKANGSSFDPVVSVDGSLVVFSSHASNLVSGDRNSVSDIFVKRNANDPGVARSVQRVSIDGGGGEANGGSVEPDLSSNKHFVVFTSYADNLVAGDRNNKPDVFVKNIERVDGCKPVGRESVGFDSEDSKSSAVPGDCESVVRVSVPDGVGGEANNGSRNPAVSGDGNLVVFESPADNLVPGDTNKAWDVFVRDIKNNKTTRVSTNGNVEGNEDSREPDISSDGRYVVFASEATNLVGGDTNKVSDVFVKDLVTGELTRVSVRADGGQADSGSGSPSISAGGQYVAFHSGASNLDPGVVDTNKENDVFVKTPVTGLLREISIDENAVPGDHASSHPVISGDGRVVQYETQATNLNPFDTNDLTDIYTTTWNAP